MTPIRMATTMVPSAPPMAMSDPCDTDNGPAVRLACSVTGARNEAPHDRQTWAHAGLACPQLAHSSASLAIGGEPSTRTIG